MCPGRTQYCVTLNNNNPTAQPAGKVLFQADQSNVIRQDGKVHRHLPLHQFLRHQYLQINRIILLEQKNKYEGRNERKVILLQGFLPSHIKQ